LKRKGEQQQTSAAAAAQHDTSLRYVANIDIDMTSHLRK
jgi:hypothetical protein